MIYRAVAEQGTLDFLFACSARDRRTLAKLFLNLTVNPFQTGEYQELDESGRAMQVQRTGNILVTFWADHAARELRVVRLDKIE